MAGGRVRCGSCLTVFFGTDHLQWDLEQWAATSDPGETLDALLKEIDVFEAADGIQVEELLVPPEAVAEVDELFEKAWEAAPQTPPVVPQEALLESPETDDLAVAPTAPVELPATDLDQGAESPVAEEWEVVSIDAAPVPAAADELSEEPIDEPVQTPQVLEPPPELHPAPDQPNAPADAVAPSPAVPRRTRRRRNRGAIRPPPAPPVATQAPLQVVVAETTDSVAGSPVPLIAAPESALISPELLAPEPLAAEAIALEPEVPQRRRRVRWMLLLPVGAILLAVQVGVYFSRPGQPIRRCAGYRSRSVPLAAANWNLSRRSISC